MDLDRVRAAFPALGSGTAFFDGPGGSQVPQVVADAVAATLTGGLANRGQVTAAERRAEDVVVAAREAMADLVGGEPGGVVFGRSMTQLTMDLARTLSEDWGPRDEVIVTRLDHDANIRPWVIAAHRVGATVRWLGFDPVTAELDDIAPLLNDRTRLVAVTGASNLFGTRPDVPAISAAAHAAGALVYVDAVHLVPHAPVDRVALGADLLACSPYKFFGPHLGAVVGRPGLLELLHPDKLLPSTDVVPERFELGTLPYELLAGVTAAVDFIADIAPETTGTTESSGATDRRTRVVESMTAVEAHEDELFARLWDGLGELERVTRHGSPVHRTPTALFSVDGVPHRVVHEHLASLDVNAPASHFYALEAARWAGLRDDGGVRAGLAPYTSAEEVDRLLAGLSSLP